MDNERHSANDAARRGEECALRRAEQKARETAARTGTPLVIYRDGKIEKRIVTREVVADAKQSGPATGAEQ